MYIFKGKKLTEDQAKKFAEETGRDLQTFLEANPDIQEDPDFGPQDELGKPEVAVEKVAPAVTEDTASQSEDGSLEPSRTSIRSKTRISDLNKIKDKQPKVFSKEEVFDTDFLADLPGGDKPALATAGDLYKKDKNRLEELENKRKLEEQKIIKNVANVDDQIKMIDNLNSDNKTEIKQIEDRNSVMTSAIKQMRKDVNTEGSLSELISFNYAANKKNTRLSDKEKQEEAERLNIPLSEVGDLRYQDIELDTEVEGNIIDAANDLNIPLQKIAEGRISIEEKEQLVNIAKTKALDTVIPKKIDEYSKEYRNQLDRLKLLDDKIKSSKVTTKSSSKEVRDHNETIKLYNDLLASTKEQNEDFNKNIDGLKAKYIVSNGEKIINNYKTSNKIEDYNQSMEDSPYKNAAAKFANGMYSLVKQGSVALPQLGIRGLGAAYDFLGGDLQGGEDTYNYFDAFADQLGVVAGKDLGLPETNKFTIVDKEGKFNWTGANIANDFAEAVPFSLYIMQAAARGDMNKATKLISNAYKKGKYVSNAQKSQLIVVQQAFKATVDTNIAEGKRMGLNDTQALAFGTNLALAEGMIETILPEQAMVTAGSKVIKAGLFKNLKNTANIKSAKNAAGRFIGNIGLNTLEEELNFAYSEMLKLNTGLIAQSNFLTDLTAHKKLVASSIVLSAGLGGVGAYKDFNRSKDLIYKEIIDQSNGMLDVINAEIKNLPRDQNGEVLEESKQTLDQLNEARVFTTDLVRASKISPENVSAEQLDLVVEKQKLIDEKKKLDSSFHGPINEKIAAVDKQISESKVAQTKEEVAGKIKKGVEKLGEKLGFVPKRLKDNAAVEEYLNEVSPDKDNVKRAGELGFFVVKPDGSKEFVINEEANAKEGVITTEAHEALHYILYESVKNSPESQTALGEALIEELKKIDQGQIAGSDFAKRLNSYLTDPDITTSEALEEALTLFSEATLTGDIVYNENVMTKIGDFIRQTLQAIGIGQQIVFNDGRDVFNFIKDYNNSIKKGRADNFITEVAKKPVGKLVKPKTKTDSKTEVKESRIISPQAIDLKDALSNEELVESIKSPTTEDKFSVAQAIVEKNFGLIRDSNVLTFEKNNPTQINAVKEILEEQILGVFEGSGRGKYSARKTGLFNSYESTKEDGASPSTYLLGVIKTRKPEIDVALKERAGVTGEDLSKAEGITVTESTPAQVDTKKIKPSSLLPSDVVSKVNKEVKEKLKDVPADKLTFKKLGNLAPEIIAEAIGIPVKKLTDATANLSKSDASAIQRFISQKPETLIKLLPEGAVLEAATQKLMGTSTGVPKSLLDAFYTKQDRTTDPSGLYPFKLNSNLNRANFLEAFGIVDGKKAKDFSPRSAEAQRLKGIASLFGRLVTNEIARSEGDLSLETAKDVAAGKSRLMFSLSEASQAKDINAAGKIAGIKGKITINDSNRPARQKEILKSIIEGKVPTIIFEAGRFGNFGRWNRRGKIVQGKFIPIPKIGTKYFKTKDGTLIKENSKEYKKAVEDGNFLPGRGGLYYGVKDPAYIEARDAAKKNDKLYPNLKKPKRVNMINAFTEAGQAQSKANMDTLETMANVLAKAVADGTMTKENAALFIASSYQATTGLIKIAAPFKYRSKIFEYGLSGKQRKGDKYREEHNPPASVIGSNLIWAIANNKVSEVMPSIRENFNQTQLSKKDDEKIDNAKLDSTLPIGTTILDNPVTRIAASGINLNSIINVETGKTLAEENGVGVETKFENNLEVYTKQNELILKLNSDKNFTESQAKKQIDQFVKIAPSIVKASKSNNDKSAFKYSKTPTNKTTIETAATTDKALNVARDLDAPIKKIRVFDFDDTLAQTKSDVLYTMPDGTEGKLNAEQFANDGSTLLSEGAVFDFSEFNKVTEGKKGPLFKVAQTIAAKRGTEDVFVLTARAPESQLAIYEFLKSQGLDIPLKNITGLGNSTGEAKARWIVDKAADGYNDFYFADDAPQNVKAVRDALSVIDVKSKTQQAKIKFSKSLDLNKDFNDIIENKTGIGSDKTYSSVKAEVAGASKGKFNFFIPPSAEDFVGLLYSTLGKGDVGDAQMAWYKSHLLNPFARAMENLANDRANMMQDFRGLKKSLGIVPKNLRKKIKDSNFTKEQAVRAYIWDKQGMEIPGISQKDQKDLVDFVNADAELVVFGDQLIEIGKGDAYAAPDAGWVAGNIGTDFIKALNTTKRSKYLETWQQNVDQIFSEANLNKLEAAYGANYREAMVDMLKRMRTGRNTSSGSDRLAARFTDWLTNSVGAIMFFNTRSAVLQTISAVNFINFSDNNVLKAGAAFANQPQYWSDFKKLFNSPFLLDRRSGLKLNVNEADIAAMAKGPGNSARNVIAGILKAGFLPTQLADSFAIASGGASFYRNRIKALKKEGLTEAEAEEIAFRDFREIAEESQQSSRPDKISQQQAGPLGRVVLAFANTPAQYARLIKKAASDIKNSRGDAKTNISKIIYYGVAQNLLFSALQQALFAIAFDDDEEEEKKDEKYFNIVNGMSDSILRGVGVGGAIVSVVKNTAIRLAKEADKKSPKYQDTVVKEVLQISPPISSKVGKLRSAGRSFSWNQEEMRTKGWSIDNPAYLASANVISAVTNVPLDRAVKKITNIVDAGNEDIEYYKRVALALGWSAWELGIDKKEGKVAAPKTDMDKLYDLNKKQQIDSLLSLGLNKKQIKLLKLEEDRVKAILDPKSVKKIKVSKRDSLFSLNKKNQVEALEKLGFTKKEIKALRLENDRVEAIINKQKQEN